MSNIIVNSAMDSVLVQPIVLQAKVTDTFLDLLVDPGLLPVGVGLGLGDAGGVRVVSGEAPSNFYATQHIVPSKASAARNYRTTNVS